MKETASNAQEDAIDVDQDIQPSPEDAEELGKDEDDEFSPDGIAGRDAAGQVDANGDVTRCICGREGECKTRMRCKFR
jgi:hypothetical protein